MADTYLDDTEASAIMQYFARQDAELLESLSKQ